MKILFSFLVCCLIFLTSFSQPVITTFSPASGPVGTVVTISGSGFNTTSANNIVFFGAVKAVVGSASSTSLSVTVPLGATYENITVLNTATGLIGSSLSPFKMTFSGNISATSFPVDGTSFFVTTDPIPLAAADLDGDGKVDMIAGNSVSNSISIFRNKATLGVLDASSFATRQDKSVGATPMGIAIGDLTGDGKPEIAVANFGANTVYVFRNTSTIGSISFAAFLSLTTGSKPFDLAIADLNGDGLQDIAVANSGTTTVSVFKNTMASGTLSFAVKTDFTVGTGPKGIAIGDIDGNGIPDIVTSNSGSSNISVLRNTTSSGSISFASKVDKTAVPLAVDIDLGDLDGDGKLDIAVVNTTGTTGNVTNGVSVFLNSSTSGSITLANKVDFSTYWGQRYIAIEDLNGDGKPDLATNGGITDGASGQVSILQNNSTIGSLSIASNINWGSGTGAYGLAVVDYDLDGRPDMSSVAFAGVNGGKINLRRNNGDEPIVTSFTPTSGPAGTTVTITGSKFTGATAVSFGGTAATSFTVVNATTITAIVGSGTTGTVSVTTARGTRASSTAFTLRYELSASIYAVGGGGGGGKAFGSNSHGGGGGSGGTVVSLPTSTFSTDSYLSITVGNGGFGANLPTSGSLQTNGGASTVVKGVATILSATGGNKGVNALSNSGGLGGTGGSGGGAGGKGGTYPTTSAVNGSIGSNALSSWGAIVGYGQDVGGIYYFSGGGAGGAYSGQSTNAVGGSGGGGGGANSGTPNTGGGGGGANSDASSGTTLTGGNGGSGIVIVRYAGSPIATGGTITASGGNTYHTFTSSGTLSIIVITSQPSTASQTLCMNTTASSLSVVASGSSPSYQWYSNPTASNVDGTLIDGATSISFTPPTSSDGTAYYYCMVTTSLGTDVSTVSGAITTISSVPGSISGGGSVTPGTNSTTLTLSGYTGTVKWQSSSDDISFSDISGATSNTYTATNLSSTMYYLAVVKNGLCTAENTTSVAIAMISSNTWIGGVDIWSSGSNWSNGSVPSRADEIVISSGTPQLDIDFSVEGILTLSGSGTLTINPGKTLSVPTGGVADFGGKLVTFKSDATGTGQMGVVAGTLTGATNITVERHIPAGSRAFRLFASPVSTTNNTTNITIKDNWMEGATMGKLAEYPYRTVSPQNPNLGYGTLVTGTGGNANGFDESQTNNPSLFTFNNITGAWVTSTNTNTMISAGSSYRMMVRGDRSYGITAKTEPLGGSTILRTTGTMAQGILTTGTQLPTLSQAASGWSLVGNPYQSVVDMASAYVVKNNLTEWYYIWDPRMATRGAYIAFNLDPAVLSSNNVLSEMNRYVQPGQAFFVQNSATAGSNSIVFNEAAKGAVSNQSATFARNNTSAGAENGYTIDATTEKAETYQTQSANYASLNAILYYTDSLAAGAPAMDATRVLFSSQFSNIVDAKDGRKFTNLDETMSIKQGTSLLSMELRGLPDTSTKLLLNITQYVEKKYTMRLFWDEKLSSDTLIAYLRDKYTNKETEVKNTGNTDFEYLLDADAKSSAADRFEIIFRRTSNQVTAVINYDNGQYIKIYPNPVRTTVKVEFELGQARLVDMKVYDMTGRLVMEKKSARTGSSINMMSLAKGTYNVQVWGGSGKLLMNEKIIKD